MFLLRGLRDNPWFQTVRGVWTLRRHGAKNRQNAVSAPSTRITLPRRGLLRNGHGEPFSGRSWKTAFKVM